jgi:signal transduction histidine kinase
MIEPQIPVNEVERQRAVDGYGVLDTLPEVAFDDITRMAALICGTPVATVSIVDRERQWFKSTFGISIQETPRSISFCAHTINNNGSPLVVEDATLDVRFADNPLVANEPHVAFYAGVPLVNADGYTLGALCVLDNKANKLTAEQLDTLQCLARQVMALFELRRANRLLELKQNELRDAYHDLDQFTVIASHDLRSPLNNIISLSSLIDDLYGKQLDKDAADFFKYLKDSSYKLLYMVNGILEYSKFSQISVEEKSTVDVPALFAEIEAEVNHERVATINYQYSAEPLVTNGVALKQILVYLVGHAIGQLQANHGMVRVAIGEQKYFYEFSVTNDSGDINDEERERMFNLSDQLKAYDTDEAGAGIGLAVAKRLIKKLGGNIAAHATPTAGITVAFSIPKP